VVLRPVPEENYLSARLAYRPNDSAVVGGSQTLGRVADVRLSVENQDGKAYIFLFGSGDTLFERALSTRRTFGIPAQDADLREAVQALEELIAQQSGILPQNFDTFLKLLYFSAVTAATVGYGDIVPARKLSRLFATVQAVVSIVMLSYYVGRVVSASDGTAIQKTFQ
jgi:voltage-gated potassium channel Kch